MKDKTKGWVYPTIGILIITIIVAVCGYFLISGIRSEFVPPDEGEGSNLGGRSGPNRFIVGTATTSPVLFNTDDDLLAIATSSDVALMLMHTDSVLFTIEQAEASTTNEFYWHITGSNDDDCETQTPDNINWYDLIADDVTPSGYDNTGLINRTANATGTSFLLTDVNWSCLRTEYTGASTTVLMQMIEKILTINN